MSKIKWSHGLRVCLYTRVKYLWGTNLNNFGSRGKPKGTSKKDWLLELDAIGIELGLGPGKGGAISNQIAWLFCVPGSGCHQGHWNNRDKNILAAQEAGFLATLPNIGTEDLETLEPVSGETKSGLFTRMWKGFKSIFT